MLLLLGLVLNGNSTAQAARPRVFVQAPGTIPRFIGQPAALGLFVPGAGATSSREDAIAALRRGKVENAVLGGKPSGRIRIDVVTGIPHGERRAVVLLELPTGGERANTTRYPVAIAGDTRYRGILTSSSTRIRGLVSVADIADIAEDLAAEKEPDAIGTRAGTPADLERLDTRLSRAHDVRDGALGVTVGLLAGLGGIGYLLRSRFAGRSAVIFGAAVIAASLITSGAGLERVTPVLLGLAGISLALAGIGALLPRPPLVAAAIMALLVVLAVNTAVNSFAPIGPYPENGGRFYGLSNTQETLLLAPVLAAAAGVWFVPLAGLTLFTVGWSHAGADGGGVLVFAVALMVLALRTRGIALTQRRLAAVAAAAILLGLALVGLDAALGGSSHVTRSISSGSVFDEIWHRWRLSAAVIASATHKWALFVVSVAGLVWLATRRPRFATLDAMLVAVAVSLVVNDTPVDVAGIGALGGLALLAWERTRPSVDSRRMRRPLLVLPLLALALAGCGSEGTVRATPETVVGTVQAEAPGKAIFNQQGCNGCHTYQPAGSAATIGPDLDKLPEYAKTAKQPLDAFVEESIVKPSAYIEKGYQDVMPKQYGSLPKSDLDDLVAFLTKPSG